MRIVDIREKTVSIASPIANAYIDFSKMTCSVVAVITDQVRDGKPVIGYGFNSNGRYGQGALMRDRFLARITEADPDTLIVADGTSCRHQIKDGTDRAPLHVARVLAMSLDSARSRPYPSRLAKEPIHG